MYLQVWKKVVYVDRLLQLFRYVPREQLTIPDFVFQLSFYGFLSEIKTHFYIQLTYPNLYYWQISDFII